MTSSGPRLHVREARRWSAGRTPPRGGASSSGVSESAPGRMIGGAYRRADAHGPRPATSASLPYIRGLARRRTRGGRPMTADPATLGLDPELDASGDEPRRGWRPTRMQWALAIWLATVGFIVWKWHLTTDSRHLFIIIGTGLIAAGAGRLRTVGRVIVDWAPLFFVLAAYESLRGYAGKWLTVNVTPQIHADQFLFGGTV